MMRSSRMALLALAPAVMAANLRQSITRETSTALVQQATSAAPPTRTHARRKLDFSDSTFIGCFVDVVQDRILDYMMVDKDKMTTEFCYNYCADKGAKFFATQYAKECFCSTEEDLDYARHGDDATCDDPCAGDENEICGGSYAFSLFVMEESAPTDTSPTPASASPSPSDMTELVDLHNQARCFHNANPLTWSNEVASSAAQHAERLQASCGELFHSTTEQRYGYGENLYMCWGSDECYSHEQAMEGLYNEEVEFGSVTQYGGHATQILWKSTTEVGCILATCTQSNGYPTSILVCQYNPPGNYNGQTEQEVELPNPGNTC